MSILPDLKARFHAALAGMVDDPAEMVELVRRSQDPKFGDYQANMAMPLAKRLGRPPRQIAAEIVARLDVSDLCAPPEIAGPGFINLRIHERWLIERLTAALGDPRLGVAPVARPRTFVIDFSAPNVAKPMHVGHIRSTVIGDALCRVLRFLGHRVISDNHIGDWGTQFGMILYGYKHFLNADAYRQNPVEELARLYKVVRQLMDYRASFVREVAIDLVALKKRKVYELSEARIKATNTKTAEKLGDEIRRAQNDLDDAVSELTKIENNRSAIENDPRLSKLAADHPTIRLDVLAETAKLHAGDAENRRLWSEFLPHCEDEIDRMYRRLGVTFDHTLGESFYEDRLAAVVEELLGRGIACESDGAVCIFIDGIETPMLVRKKDGAFLYGTTDLATIRYRMDQWRPDAILYVVDHRQSLHFKQLFAAARLLGYENVELQHVSFGTVLGDDGRPFKTRAGDTVGLESLLDEAVRRALEIVSANDDAKPEGRELSDDQRRQIAERVGIAALKYADLSQNRTSDYVFSYDKMLAMSGNTATYMQYAYARVRSIFSKGNIDIDALRSAGTVPIFASGTVPIFASAKIGLSPSAPPSAAISLDSPAERALAVELLRFSEALDLTAADYRPNQLTAYLFDVANRYSTFFEQCHVLRAPNEALRHSRLLLCDLTARTIQKGLKLLGIEVVEKM
ncbi:MAG: arginine--tRNA ligase [Thermoguttaceae bacterium]